MVSRKLYVYFLFDEVDEHGSVKFFTNLMGSGKFSRWFSNSFNVDFFCLITEVEKRNS